MPSAALLQSSRHPTSQVTGNATARRFGSQQATGDVFGIQSLDGSTMQSLDGSSTPGSTLTVGSSVCAVPREVDARRIPESVEVGGSTVAELTDLGQARLSVSVDRRSAHVTRSQWSSHACARESFVPASGVSCVAESAAASAASSVACPTGRTSAVVGLCMREDGTSMHGACNSGGTGGLLPVQRSTSCCLGNSWSDPVRVQGPTGTRRVRGGVSGPAEDLRPVAEVEAGVNFRPACGVREQVAGSLPGGNQAQVPGRLGEVRAHLPSTQRFLVSNSCHLDTDWTSGNQWAGRRCVDPHSRGFGCQRVTAELVCSLPILTTFGWNG